MASRATGEIDSLPSSSRAGVVEEGHHEHRHEEVREMGDERGQAALEVVVPITREVGVLRQPDDTDRDVLRCMPSGQLRIRSPRATLSVMVLMLQM